MKTSKEGRDKLMSRGPLMPNPFASLFSSLRRASLGPTRLKMSADGRAKLIAREGRRLLAYVDSVGVLTVGVGHTAMAGEPIPKKGMKITDAECDAILARDLLRYEEQVRDSVKVPLSQGEFDALVSLCFNIGTGAFSSSSVVKRLNAGNRKGAAEAILMWNQPFEIIGRRKTEYRQFAQAAGIPPDSWIA